MYIDLLKITVTDCSNENNGDRDSVVIDIIYGLLGNKYPAQRKTKRTSDFYNPEIVKSSDTEEEHDLNHVKNKIFEDIKIIQIYNGKDIISTIIFYETADGDSSKAKFIDLFCSYEGENKNFTYRVKGINKDGTWQIENINETRNKITFKERTI